MAEQFAGLLWGDLLIGLLLRVVDQPSPREMARRARDATAAFLALYAEPRSPHSQSTRGERGMP
jgi:hypothetical protein